MDNFLVICLNNAFSSFLFADGFSLGGLLLGLFDLFEVGFGWVRLFFDSALLGIFAHNGRVDGEIGGSLVLEAVSHVDLAPGPS